MAPQRKHADENGTGSSVKERASTTTGAGVGKGKKSGAGHSKDAVSANAANAGGTDANGHAGQNIEALDFNHLPRRALHAYRVAHGLHQPSSFRGFHNGVILSLPGSVGLQSPTMLRPRERRRVPKSTLARAVRSHFMDQSVNELDVEARMMYNVKSIDKVFRMKFTPQTPGKK